MAMLSSVPFHFFLVILYVIVAGVLGFGDISAYVFGPGETAAAEEAATSAGAALETRFNAAIYQLPLFNGPGLAISTTTIFIALGFVSQWIEARRATRVRGTGGNDFMSLILAFVAFLLFVGVEPFQTTAFLVVVIVGFGDVLLDRVIGQAVARRDFGAVIPGVPHE